jgi:hypothetical protein
MRGLVFAIVLAACGGGGAPPNVDAHPGGPLCVAKLYDQCIEEHDCVGEAFSGVCQNFGTFQICSQACTTTCPPDQNGSPATCESGVCKPSEPNMCHLPGQ